MASSSTSKHKLENFIQDTINLNNNEDFLNFIGINIKHEDNEKMADKKLHSEDEEKEYEEDHHHSYDSDKEWIDPEITTWQNLMIFLGINKEVEGIQESDMLDKEFVSMEQAETFYKLYSRLIGFGVRKKIKRKNKSGRIIIRSWVCSNQGFREKKYLHIENRSREPRNLTRTGCHATFRINLKIETDTWIVKCFKMHHNHALALSHQKPFIRSHRKLSEAAREQAMLMKRSGIRTCNIWQYLVEQNGGWEKVGCIKSDLYRGLRGKYAVWDDIDTSTAMSYLESKKEQDPDFFYKHATDNEGRLTNLFWADTTMKVDYQLFGDCLAFDSTYKTNKYGKPLVVLVCTNNHGRSCIVGFALIQNELAETYKWVLETFLECMECNKPDTVLTDGCRSMNKALEEVLPEAVHRICAWHIIKNSLQHIHKIGFTEDLKKMIFRYYIEEEWEEKWIDLKEKYNLLDNDWLDAQYSTRHMWADSFLRGHYFGGSRATGICESMNSFLKRDLDEGIPLWMFLRHCDYGLSALRFNEMSEHYKTTMTEPLLNQTNMPFVEEQVASIFSREIYTRVKNEIMRADQYVVLLCEKIDDYECCKVAKYMRTDPKHKIVYSSDGNNVKCDCYWFETKGIPCRHIFAAMKHLNKSNFPQCLVKSRWLKDAKDIDPSSLGKERKCPHPDQVENTRYGEVSMQSNLVAFYASKSGKAYNHTMKVMNQLVIDLKNMTNNELDDQKAKSGNTNLPYHIEHPLPVPTKGRPTQSKASKNKGKK